MTTLKRQAQAAPLLFLLAAVAGCGGEIAAPAAPDSPVREVGIASAPKSPGNVYVTGQGAGKVQVYWNDSSTNETYFRVRRGLRNPNGTFTYATIANRGPNTTSHMDSTVVIGSTYRYTIWACNADGCTYGPYSLPFTVVLPPARPTNLTATVSPIRRVDLAWVDSSGNETRFRVRRALRDSSGVFGAYQYLFNVLADSTTAADTSVAAGKVYRYQVQACNNGGCGTSTPVVVNVPPVPAAPTGASALRHDDHIDLTWTDHASNESSYRIRRREKVGSGPYGTYVLVDTEGANANSYSDHSVLPGKTYQYYVQACNPGGCANSNLSLQITMPAGT